MIVELTTASAVCLAIGVALLVGVAVYLAWALDHARAAYEGSLVLLGAVALREASQRLEITAAEVDYAQQGDLVNVHRNPDTGKLRGDPMTAFITVHSVSTESIDGRERTVKRDTILATNRIAGAMTLYPRNRAGELELDKPAGSVVNLVADDEPLIVAESPAQILELVEAAEAKAHTTVHFDI